MRNHHAPATTPTTPPLAQPADHALRHLADQLTAAGLDTRSPAWEDRGYLKITNTPGAVSELTITPCGHVTWEYRPAHPGHNTPARLAAIILALLDPTAPDDIATEPRADLTPASLAGRALVACGLSVTLAILDVSQTRFDIYSELRITNPACPERGIANLTGDGTIWWECRTHQTALSLADIAGAITRALSTTRHPEH